MILMTLQSVSSEEFPASSMVRYSDAVSSLNTDSLGETGQVIVKGPSSFESKAPVTA